MVGITRCIAWKFWSSERCQSTVVGMSLKTSLFLSSNNFSKLACRLLVETILKRSFVARQENENLVIIKIRYVARGQFSLPSFWEVGLPDYPFDVFKICRGRWKVFKRNKNQNSSDICQVVDWSEYISTTRPTNWLSRRWVPTSERSKARYRPSYSFLSCHYQGVRSLRSVLPVWVLSCLTRSHFRVGTITLGLLLRR